MTPDAATLPTDDACYLALKARDARFDGRFFTGVTSTGIYCRPVCRVRTPKRENCRFFGHAAQAESAGFRPCLRCRPGTGAAFGGRGRSRTRATSWRIRRPGCWTSRRPGASAAPSVRATGRRGWASATAMCGASSRRSSASRPCSTCRRAGC